MTESEKLSQHQRMKAAGRVQTLLWLSAESSALLKRLATDMQLTQVEVVERSLQAFSGSSVADVQPESMELLSRIETMEYFLSSFYVDGIAERLDAIEASISSVVSSVSGLSERLEVVEAMGKVGSAINSPDSTVIEGISDSDRELMKLGKVKVIDLLDEENGQRNRRILQMHRDYEMNPTAIGSQLKKEGFENNLPASVRGFLEHREITPYQGKQGRRK